MRTLLTILLIAVTGLSIYGDSGQDNFEKRIIKAYEMANTDKKKAVQMIKDIYIDAEKEKNDAVCARCLSSYAYWLHNEDCSHLSLTLFLKALEICPEEKRELRASSLLGMLHCYRMLKQDDKATELFGECVSLYREIGDSVGVMTAFCSYGLTYAQKGDEAKAIELYNRGLVICR